MDCQQIIDEIDQRVLTLTLNRPEKLNAVARGPMVVWAQARSSSARNCHPHDIGTVSYCSRFTDLTFL
jgi:hypothetical protein